VIKVKRNLEKLIRIKNTDKRIGSIRLDKNERIVGFKARDFENLLNTLNPDLLASYPELDSLCEKIAAWVKIRPGNLMLSNGSDGAIKSVFEVFVRRNDDVVCLDPSYAMYTVYAKIFSARYVAVHYDNNLELSAQKIFRHVTPKTRLVILANPNSPTGTIIPHQDLLRFIERMARRDVLVLVDEAYYPFYPNTVLPYIDQYKNLMVTRTFSKACGLACLRLGFVAANETLIGYLKKVRPMYETNGVAAAFASYIIDHRSLIEGYVNDTLAGRDFLTNGLKEMGFKTFKSYANFVVARVGSSDKADDIADHMAKKNILIKGSYRGTPLEDCIRITVGPIPIMSKVLDALAEIVM